jgi:hypothetical protein
MIAMKMAGKEEKRIGNYWQTSGGKTVVYGKKLEILTRRPMINLWGRLPRTE